MGKTVSLGSLAVLLIFLLLSGCGRWYQVICWPGGETEALLRDAMAGDGPSQFKLDTPTPSRQQIDFTVQGRNYSGELFLPQETPQAALLFIPGTTTAGNQDPRMVAFAHSLARARFTVLIPNLKNLKALKITPGEIQEIADSFEYLATQNAWAPAGHVGMAAVSYIVGPTLLAALEPQIRDKVRFILSIGGYHDIEAVITYVTTGQYRNEAGDWTYLEPNAHGKWVLVLSNTDRLSNLEDRRTLQEIAKTKIANPEAPIADLNQRLMSAEGKALVALMDNRDPEKVPELLDQLPASVKTDLAALDLKDADFSQLKAQVYLLHGYEDSLIPYTQSLDLEQQLPHKRLWLVHGFAHVEFDGELGWFDAWSLACLTDAVLHERKR